MPALEHVAHACNDPVVEAGYRQKRQIFKGSAPGYTPWMLLPGGSVVLFAEARPFSARSLAGQGASQ